MLIYIWYYNISISKIENEWQNGIAIKPGRMLSDPIIADTPDGDPCRVFQFFFTTVEAIPLNYCLAV